MPSDAHANLGAMFFEDVLSMRLGGDALTAVPDKSGFIGDLKAMTFQPVATAAPPTVPTAWLPTERIARAWQAVMTAKPFDP
jgi:hypothetical protein